MMKRVEVFIMSLTAVSLFVSSLAPSVPVNAGNVPAEITGPAAAEYENVTIIPTSTAVGKPGTYTAVTTGITFVINTTTEVSYVKPPKKVKILKCIRRGRRKIFVKWKTRPENEGYKIAWAADKKRFSEKNTGFCLNGSGKFKIKHLKPGIDYYVKVRAFRYDALGEKISGPWSKKRKAKNIKKLY